MGQTGKWQRATFSVPIETPQERVLDGAQSFLKQFVEAREKDGWWLTSRMVLMPVPAIKGDRKQYTVWGRFMRQPKARTIEIKESQKLVNKLVKRYNASVS